jgi:formylglycine-generating enzyme required for sulfatase activity
MKSLLFAFLFFLQAGAFAAVEPEAILLRTKEIRSQSWYHDQALAWSQKARQENKPDAWLNYYAAAKYAQWNNPDLQQIVDDAQTALKDEFTRKLLSAWNAGLSSEALQILLQLEKENPNHLLLNSLLVIHDELNFFSDSRKTHSANLFSNHVIASSLLSYSYNVLMSIEQGGLLVCDGDNTTIPMFVLQDVFNIRTDVHILNLDLLLISDYRTRRLQSCGMVLDGSSLTDKQSLCAAIAAANQAKKVYYALTVPQQHITSIKDQLFVVGLASQATRKRIDNVSFIRENLENKFLLDNLTVDFSGENQYATGKILSTNYLVPMLLLLEHYKSIGDIEKVNRWQATVNRLAKETGKEMLVQNFISKNDNAHSFIAADINPKHIEGKFKLVKGNIYAGESEITNLEYNAFLRYLKENKRDDVYAASNFDLSKYEGASLALMKNYHMDRQPLKKERYFTNYPAINISHEGALAYCEWLTEQYNNSRDRKFKKVKFRLPTLNEWRIAALGYKNFQSWDINENQIEMTIQTDDKEEICRSCPKKLVPFTESGILYPWYFAYNYRDKPLNSRGCSLGNFQWPDGQKHCNPKLVTPDGFVLTSPVQAYFPNGMGLYDVVGNVAEMINEPGKACGGSWNHPPEQSTIMSVNNYDGPDSAIGFRVFMEVIEQ